MVGAFQFPGSPIQLLIDFGMLFVHVPKDLQLFREVLQDKHIDMLVDSALRIHTEYNYRRGSNIKGAVHSKGWVMLELLKPYLLSHL